MTDIESTGHAVDIGLDRAGGINDAGQVVGSLEGRPAYWDPSTATIHELSSDGDGYASCINDHAQAAGVVSWTPTTETGRAVIWDLATGEYTELGLSDVYVHDINEYGQVLGSDILGSTIGAGPWIWEPSAQAVIELPARFSASAINDLGYVVATREVWIPAR